jgi:hypothetical protein
MQLKQLEKRWEEHHVPVTSAALALDPERMDHEQPESVEFHWDKEIIAQEVLSSKDAASKKKRLWLDVYKDMRNAEMQEDTGMGKDARTLTGHQWCVHI